MKNQIEQKENELIIHQNVARMKGKLTPVQSKGMNSILKRAYEIVSHEPDTREFVIPTDMFINDLNISSNDSNSVKVSKLHREMKKLMHLEFEWGTVGNLFTCIFMQKINVNIDNVTLKFSDDIREHIKPLNKALIIKDFRLLQSFNSEYARQLFKHLMAWDSKQTAEFTIEDLKAFLGVPDTTNYKRMDKIKRILDKAVNEINEKCPNMQLAYIQKKTGRKITHIAFGWLKHKKREDTKLTEIQRFCIDCVGKYIENSTLKILKVECKNDKFEVDTELGKYIFPNLETLQNELKA